MGTWKERQTTVQCLIFPFLYDRIGDCALSESDSRTTSQRDYAYAGSFYAFAIWIGMGAAGCCDMLRRKHFKVLPVSLLMLLCLLIPVQMASQTWDDHDRSDRYMARDFGQNYLMSLQESGNPIIYTNGDNDTFPLVVQPGNGRFPHRCTCM